MQSKFALLVAVLALYAALCQGQAPSPAQSSPAQTNNPAPSPSPANTNPSPSNSPSPSNNNNNPSPSTPNNNNPSPNSPSPSSPGNNPSNNNNSPSTPTDSVLTPSNTPSVTTLKPEDPLNVLPPPAPKTTSSSTSAYYPYDPCQPLYQYETGDKFVFGLAFWPGAVPLDWGPEIKVTQKNQTQPTFDTQPGLTPCIGDVVINDTVINYRQRLAQNNVYISTFAVAVDTLSAVQSSEVEELLLLRTAADLGKAPVLSVVAFRGTIRSEARFIRSRSPESGGQGSVQSMYLLISLDRGNLVALDWYDVNKCRACGGPGSSECIETAKDGNYVKNPQQSCATSNAQCDSALVNCTTTFYTGFRGSSKSGQPMESSYQITSIDQYSISGFFNDLFTNVDDEIGVNAVGQVGGGINSGVYSTGNGSATTTGGLVAVVVGGGTSNVTVTTPKVPPPTPAVALVAPPTLAAAPVVAPVAPVPVAVAPVAKAPIAKAPTAAVPAAGLIVPPTVAVAPVAPTTKVPAKAPVAEPVLLYDDYGNLVPAAAPAPVTPAKLG